MSITLQLYDSTSSCHLFQYKQAIYLYLHTLTDKAAKYIYEEE